MKATDADGNEVKGLSNKSGWLVIVLLLIAIAYGMWTRSQLEDSNTTLAQVKEDYQELVEDIKQIKESTAADTEIRVNLDTKIQESEQRAKEIDKEVQDVINGTNSVDNGVRRISEWMQSFYCEATPTDVNCTAG